LLADEVERDSVDRHLDHHRLGYPRLSSARGVAIMPPARAISSAG
jgi:hypothetical protein